MEEDGGEALGRSRGGLTTKVHLLADDRARPLCWLTSPGQRGDSLMFGPVLEALRGYLRRGHIKATIAQPDDQRANHWRKGSAGGRPPAFDRAQYRRRSAAERCVHKWKQYPAVATR